ncbi:MAG: acyl carrier protein [Cytophagales bacterium]|nr:acyl carrier protein [Rhizobacter sp.]
MSTTFERLGAILARDYKFSPEQLTRDAPLEGLGIDSLGLVELLWNVEEEFKITLGSQPVEMLTVGDVVRYIDELVANQAGVSKAGGRAGSASLRVT